MSRRLLLVAQGVAVGLVVMLFALLVWKIVVNEGGALVAAVSRGEQPVAPDFTLERLDRKGELSVGALRGKAVVVNFWASWCIPCRDEAPFLEEVWRKNRSRGLVVLGVDVRDFRADARSFVAKYGVTFPTVYDGPAETAKLYGLTGLPESFVVDRRGRVIAAFVGAINSDEDRERLAAAVERALGS